MILHPLLIAYDGIAEGVTEYLFLVSLFARKYDEKAFLTSSLVGWGVFKEYTKGTFVYKEYTKGTVPFVYIRII